MEREKYIKELKLLNEKYQNAIKLQREVKFGVEIEFSDALKDDVIETVNKYINKIEKDKSSKYLIWNVTDELTVQKRIDGKIYGGELVSPIFENDYQSWEKLKKIERCFKLENFSFNDNCGFHVHFDTFSFRNIGNMKFRRNLLKMWMLFEDIIYRTAYGYTNIERKNILKHALPTNYYIYKNINCFNDDNIFYDFLKRYAKERNYGLNLSNLHLEGIYIGEKHTYEIRCANALENLFLMQNTIKFYLNFFNYCDSRNFDEEYVNYLLKSFEPMFINRFREEKFDKALSLANLIYEDEIDKMLFMKQYLKCMNEPKKELPPKEILLKKTWFQK